MGFEGIAALFGLIFATFVCIAVGSWIFSFSIIWAINVPTFNKRFYLLIWTAVGIVSTCLVLFAPLLDDSSAALLILAAGLGSPVLFSFVLLFKRKEALRLFQEKSKGRQSEPIDRGSASNSTDLICLNDLLKKNWWILVAVLLSLALLPHLEFPSGSGLGALANQIQSHRIEPLSNFVFGSPLEVFVIYGQAHSGIILPYFAPLAFIANLSFWIAFITFAFRQPVLISRNFVRAISLPLLLMALYMFGLVLIPNQLELPASDSFGNIVTKLLAIGNGVISLPLLLLFLLPDFATNFLEDIVQLPVFSPLLTYDLPKPSILGYLLLVSNSIGSLITFYMIYLLVSIFVRSGRIFSFRKKLALFAILYVAHLGGRFIQIWTPTLQPLSSSSVVICGVIYNSAVRNACIQTARGDKLVSAKELLDPSFCNLSIAGSRKPCISKIAKERKDPRLCHLLGEEIHQCMKSTLSASPKFCADLPTAEVQDRCIRLYLSNPNPEEGCDYFSSDPQRYKHSACLNSLAPRTGETKYCDNLAKTKNPPSQALTDYEQCIVSVAEETKDYQICNLATESVDGCLMTVIRSRNEWENCNLISNKRTRAYCELDSAETYEDCHKTDIIDIRDYCIRQLAVKKGDRSICKSIGDSFNRDMCFKSFS
jgi:hypothetical protein